MHVVLSVGGSQVSTENGIDRSFLENLRKLLEKSDYHFGIVVGGGNAARKYADKVRAKGGNEFEADEAAIQATKENAKAVINALGKMAYGKVCTDFNEARMQAKKHRIVVMGGTIPGITTDADAALLAEALGAKRLVNISNVEGVYDSDPKKNPEAKKFDRMDYHQLIHAACEYDQRRAGENFVFDILACKLIARSKLETHFVNGKKVGDIMAALDGKRHSGTVVKTQKT
ncbi:MAG TPA: UMP kinase [Candidatus Bilamarchaeaceae archaeon]|nr:UMP kinase [Candidatus Bilamarchaeaceae archaeon]